MAAERSDDTLVIALQAGWPWSSANVMTTKTVILMKVSLSPEPDIITDNCPLISHLSWHIVPYVCKSMRALEAVVGRWGKICGRGVGLTPASERDETSSNDNDWGRGYIYHGGFHKSGCEMSGSSGKVKPLDLWVCMCVCCSAKGKVYKYHKTKKLYIKDWHWKSFRRISQSCFDLCVVGKHVKLHS